MEGMAVVGSRSVSLVLLDDAGDFPGFTPLHRVPDPVQILGDRLVLVAGTIPIGHISGPSLVSLVGNIRQ